MARFPIERLRLAGWPVAKKRDPFAPMIAGKIVVKPHGRGCDPWYCFVAPGERLHILCPVSYGPAAANRKLESENATRRNLGITVLVADPLPEDPQQ
jgi:hypothetical protein